MSDEMKQPVTRAELREELANHATKADLAPFATKDYVHEVAQTLLAQMQRTDQRLENVERTLAGMEGMQERIVTEFARHTQALIESHRGEMQAMIDPYRDHPERIAKLERAVFPDDGGGVRAKARVRRRTTRR